MRGELSTIIPWACSRAACIFRALYRERLQCNACGPRGRFRRTKLNDADRRIPEDRQPRQRRHCFSKKFDLFTSQFRKIEKYPSKIPSGASEVFSPSACYGIIFKVDADNGDHLRSFHRGPDAYGLLAKMTLQLRATSSRANLSTGSRAPQEYRASSTTFWPSTY